jgi:ArsR family transcriptional regulator, cadmium/lead-responsive transcriptional repressor
MPMSAYHRGAAMNCGDTQVAPAVALFRALADATRLAILARLAHDECRVVDLTRHLDVAQSTVSKHLASLRSCQLVDFRTEGRQAYYRLARPELAGLLRNAERLLSATGHPVALSSAALSVPEPREHSARRSAG